MRITRLLCLCAIVVFGVVERSFAAEAGVAPAINEAALHHIKTQTAPLIAADGTFTVRSLSAERAHYRYPVLRFAGTVQDHFSERIFSIGSRDFPLAIELGTQTNAVASIERRSIRTNDGFHQLIIRIPNPDTVDLDVLRKAIVEAQLREAARASKGHYGAFTWPAWFLEAMVDASRNGVWKAEAYERAALDYEAGAFPSVDDFFKPNWTPPSREMAAFFAMWILEHHRDHPKRLITTPWNTFAFIGLTPPSAWEEWFLAQASKVFMPGLLTRTQYRRWKADLVLPKDVNEAVQIARDLTREALGKPQTFHDLTSLYLKAYSAFMVGDQARYETFRAEADDAAKILDAYFETNAILFVPSETPSDTFSLSPLSNGDE